MELYKMAFDKAVILVEYFFRGLITEPNIGNIMVYLLPMIGIEKTYFPYKLWHFALTRFFNIDDLYNQALV
jgi:hypothetical protein